MPRYSRVALFSPGRPEISPGRLRSKFGYDDPMRVAMVNTNRIKPPIGPLGLEYVAEALVAAGHEVRILDLCWADDPDEAIRAFLSHTEFGLVGISIRNTDDCS